MKLVSLATDNRFVAPGASVGGAHLTLDPDQTTRIIEHQVGLAIPAIFFVAGLPGCDD